MTQTGMDLSEPLARDGQMDVRVGSAVQDLHLTTETRVRAVVTGSGDAAPERGAGSG